jgi:GNAT superfamily N-acetyltransferase
MDLVDIVPASSALWPALAALFEAGGDPKWCFCQYWRKPGANWTNTTPAENRADLEAQLDDPLPPGLVALRDDEAVGWVAVAPREAYPRLARSRTIPQLPGDDVWAITCLVVRRTARRSGVASALVAAATAFALEHGAATVEGYPVVTEGARLPAGSAYTGTLSMFERAGFVGVSPTTSHPAPGRSRVVVRRSR